MSRTSTNAAPVARATDSSSWSGTTPRTSYALKIAATSTMRGPYLAHPRNRVSGLVEPAGILAVVHLGELPGAGRSGPADRVGDDLLDLRLVVCRVLLVTRPEVEHPALAAAVAAAGPEHLAAGERAHEHQLVRLRDVEQLAVHLLALDHQRMRDALGDRVAGGNRPEQLAVVVGPPLERAGGAHQPDEDLAEVGRVQRDQAHPGQHVPLDPLDHSAAALAMRGVTPPGEHVGPGEHVVGQPVLRLLEPRRTDHDVGAEFRPQAGRDGLVHGVRVDLLDRGVALVVHVLAPDGDADRISH